jgi:hypothetical protein
VGLVAARLLAVDPDGNVFLICRGSRNLAFPDDLSSPKAPTPGEPFDVAFPLMATSAVLPAGWRLRLSLSGADFPIVWPPRQRFTLTVDPEHSSLTLPVVGPRQADTLVTVPLTGDLPTAPSEETRSVSEWEVTGEDGRHVFRFTRGGTEVQPSLTYDADQWWTITVDDDDPGTTRGHTVSRAALRRPGWEVAVEGSFEIEGSEDFDVTVEMAARFNGEEVFRRTWSEKIPRRWA